MNISKNQRPVMVALKNIHPHFYFNSPFLSGVQLICNIISKDRPLLAEVQKGEFVPPISICRSDLISISPPSPLCVTLLNTEQR